jgi:hypothetical protein
MKERKTIKINDFQLIILLNKEEQKDFHIFQNNSFCSTCMEERPLTNVQEILLNDLNDIMVEGICPICGGKMARYMAFGDNQAFSDKADLFRKQIH